MKKSTYHWVIVGAVFVLMAMTIGYPVNCFSVFAPAWVAGYGVNASTVQLVNLITTVVNAGSCLILAKIMGKLGFRKSIIMYSIIAFIGLFGRSFCPNIPTLIICSVISAFGLSGCSTIPCSLLINNWFVKDRGTATGIAFTGSVAGGLILVQLTKNWVAAAGWQKANIYLGIIFAVCMLPIVCWLAVEKPADKGMYPHGVDEETLKAGSSTPTLTGIAKAAFMKTPVFWLAAVYFFILGFCNMGFQQNMTLALVYQHGFSAEQAANIFSINMFIQIFGKILLGKIYDKAGIKVATLYTLVLFILASITMIICTGSIVLGMIFGGLFGLMSASTTVAPPYVLGSMIGRKHYADIYGVLNLVCVAGMAFGPIIASGVFDKTGSFNIVWIAFSVLYVISTICAIAGAKKAADGGFPAMTD